jgi:transcriptional regulator
VPTWNYILVQAHGRPRVIDDAAWLRAQIDALTTLQEAGRDDPWAVADAPADYVAAQLKGIAGVEIAVERIEGKWKASQNQPAANHEGVVAGLRAQDPASPMAAAMER